jgi:hypothetical protein
MESRGIKIPLLISKKDLTEVLIHDIITSSKERNEVNKND